MSLNPNAIKNQHDMVDMDTGDILKPNGRHTRGQGQQRLPTYSHNQGLQELLLSQDHPRLEPLTSTYHGLSDYRVVPSRTATATADSISKRRHFLSCTAAFIYFLFNYLKNSVTYCSCDQRFNGEHQLN